MADPPATPPPPRWRWPIDGLLLVLLLNAALLLWAVERHRALRESWEAQRLALLAWFEIQARPVEESRGAGR